MRYLAIDLGDKRTGLAVADFPGGIPAPVGVIERPMGDALLAALLSAIAEQRADALVIGLPLNMSDDTDDLADAERDGTSPAPRTGAAPSKRAKPKKPANTPADRARAFGERLAARSGLPVHYQDERLSSVQADWTMAQSGLTHKGKKKRRDALAALVILEDFLRGR